MNAVGAERQRLDPERSGRIERRVEMREQRPAARDLPFERGAERLRVDGDEQQVALPGKMLRRGFPDLLGGGEMDIAVGDVDRRAVEAPGLLGRAPQRLGADLVDDAGP